MNTDEAEELQKVTEYLKQYNQEHLVMFYDELEEDERKSLLSQIYKTDFEKIKNLYISSYEDDSIAYDRIAQIPIIDKSKLSEDEINRFVEIGNNAIRDGKYAAITMAGGQGTRLRI